MTAKVAAWRAGSMAVSPDGLGVRWNADCCAGREVAMRADLIVTSSVGGGLARRLTAGLRVAHSL